MNNSESEQIIRETIEYANKEIDRNKKKSRRLIVGILVALAVLAGAYFLIFVHETPLAYREGIVEVTVADGMDINIDLPNYKGAQAILVKTGDNSYDLYMGLTQTLSTKMFKDRDSSDHILRVGNGMIIDFQSRQLRFNIPNGNSYQCIEHVYYLDDLNSKMASMDDASLMTYEAKTLLWTK